MHRPLLPSLLSACLLACGGVTTAGLTPTVGQTQPIATVRVAALPSPQPAPVPAPAEPVAASCAKSLHAAAPAHADKAPGVRPDGFVEPVVEPDQTRALVLLYHAFDRGRAPLSVDSRRLDEHIAWMRAAHVEIVALSQLLRFLDGELALPSRVVVITIDDGDESVYRRAWPVFRRHAAPFALGLPTKLMEEKHPRLMRWWHVAEMVDSGLCEVASHGHEHKSLVHFADRRAIAQLEISKRILKERTAQVPAAFFYPLGAHDERTLRLLPAAGYRAAFTASGAPIALHGAKLFSLPRVGIEHRDTSRSLAWYFSDAFLAPVPRSR